MAAPFRMVFTAFWSDPNVVESFTPEDKFFYLYLITNEHTSQCGIYKIAPKQMAFELGYSIEAVKNLIDRFQNNLKRIVYNPETHEIAILHWAKYNYPTILKDNRLVCITAELAEVQDKGLIEKVLAYATPEIREAILGHDEPPKGEESPLGGSSEPLPSPSEPPFKPLGEEKEEEKEQEEERETRAPARDDTGKGEEKDLPALAHKVAEFWSEQYGLATGITIKPDPRTIQSAANMIKIAGMNANIVIMAIKYYFEHWRTIWFACSRDSWKGPPESRRCEFSIQSIEKNLQEVISMMHLESRQKKSWTTSTLTEDDRKPLSQDEVRQLQGLVGAFEQRVKATVATA